MQRESPSVAMLTSFMIVTGDWEIDKTRRYGLIYLMARGACRLCTLVLVLWTNAYGGLAAGQLLPKDSPLLKVHYEVRSLRPGVEMAKPLALPEVFFAKQDFTI